MTYGISFVEPTKFPTDVVHNLCAILLGNTGFGSQRRDQRGIECSPVENGPSDRFAHTVAVHEGGLARPTIRDGVFRGLVDGLWQGLWCSICQIPPAAQSMHQKYNVNDSCTVTDPFLSSASAGSASSGIGSPTLPATLPERVASSLTE